MRYYPILTIHTLTMLVGVTVFASSATAGGTLTGKLEAKKAKYRRNAVVYLEKVPGEHKATSPVSMDQQNQRFIPHVLPIVKGTIVRFLNSDNTGHNVYTPDNEKYDLGVWKKGETRERRFEQLGVYTQLCKMHPSMLAYVVVVQNPYFAVTGDDGTFVIKDIPAGTYTVKVWQEKRKAAPTQVTVTAGRSATVDFKMTR